MQRRGLLALIVLTAVVLVAAVAVSLPHGGGRGNGGNAETAAGMPVLPRLTASLGDVATLAVKHADAGLTLERRDDKWVVAEKGGYPADEAKVRQALLGLAELTFVEPKTAKPDLYPRLDVEDLKPGAKSADVEAKDASGKTIAELIVGKRRPDQLGGGNDGIYVRRLGEAQSWLAKGSLDVTGDAKEWLDKKIAAIPPARIKSVRMTHADGSTLTVEREKPEDKFAVAGAPADTKYKSDFALAEPASFLDNVELTDVQPADKAQLPTDGVTKAEIATFDGLTVAVSAVESNGAQWVRLSATGAGEAAEKEAKDLDAKTGAWVYAVLPYKVNPLKTKLEDLVEPPKAS